MAKLTDTQLIVLSAAIGRDDGIAVVPAKINRAAASKVGASLVGRKLMREVLSKPGMPVWRKDEDGRPLDVRNSEHHLPIQLRISIARRNFS